MIVGISVVVLVAIVAGLTWLSNNGQVGNNGVANIHGVKWVAPGSVPSDYTKNERQTQNIQLVLYENSTAGCAISASSYPLVDTQGNGRSLDQALADTKADAEKSGIKVTSSKPGAKLAIKAAGSSSTYDFDTLEQAQEVHVEGVDYNFQNSVLVYKQIDQSAASITYSCRADTWDANKAELESIVKQFTING